MWCMCEHTYPHKFKIQRERKEDWWSVSALWIAEEYCTTKVMNNENAYRKNIKRELWMPKLAYIHTYVRINVRLYI